MQLAQQRRRENHAVRMQIYGIMREHPEWYDDLMEEIRRVGRDDEGLRQEQSWNPNRSAIGHEEPRRALRY